MDLKRRLVKLETSATVRQERMEPVYSEEDRAIMQRIVDGWYADPVRNAASIAILERASSKPVADA